MDPSTDPRILGADDGTDPFVAAVRAAQIPMVITDPRQPDHPIVFANDAFCRLCGYERSDILGRNCRFLQGPDTDPDAVDRIREAIAAGRQLQIDIRNYRRSGEAFWNRLVLGPVFGRAGDIHYFVASQSDVTLERERLVGLEHSNAALEAELEARGRALEAGEVLLRTATAAADLGSWHLDLGSRTLFASAHCKANFGRDPDASFTYDELLKAVHPDDQARMQAEVARTVQTGQDYRIEYRIERPDQRLAWVRIHGRLERDAQGQPLRLAGFSQDITQEMLARRRVALFDLLDREAFAPGNDLAEIAYRAAEALGQVLEVSRAGYGTIDTQAETITIERDWNAPGIASLAGTLRFRDYGSYIEDLKRGETVVFQDARTDPRTRDTADALIAISARSIVNMPVSEDGDFVALLYLNHATVRPWMPEELALVREVAHRTRQVIERRRAESSLRELAASLERQVQERTAALMQTESALRQSQKMEAVGQLTGGLAHDLNNLLGAISGSLELLKRKAGTDPATARYVDVGQSATRRAAALTHRLLAFSRQQTLEPKVLDVERLIADFEDLIRRTIGPQVDLVVRPSPGLWPVRADPGQLENAVLNLCINARDAMPEGGTITIAMANQHLVGDEAATHEVVAGNYVSVCVRDTGCGMPAEVVARAFDPFFTTKPTGAGTGLGLSMVYGFARQSGGQAGIQSEEGAGTSVCLYLPRHEGQPDQAPVAPLSSPSGLAGTGAADATILVVDDEPSLRLMMADTLREIGYRVLEADNGLRAVEMLQHDPSVAMLVTDVGLPGGMNGRQIAEAARSLSPTIVVLFVTGYAQGAAFDHGELPQNMEVLTKPFDLSTFGRRVQTMLGAAAAAQASA